MGVVNAVTIDFYLWDYAKANSELMEEFPTQRIY